MSTRIPRELGELISILEGREFNGTVVFMGANMDAIKMGNSFGIKAGNCIDFSTNSDGIENVVRCATQALERASSGGDASFNTLERTQSQRVSPSIVRRGNGLVRC